MLPNSNLTKSKFKLICLVKSLSRKEWRRFGDFIRSPFFNKQEKLVLLYDLLHKRFPFKEDIYKTDLLPLVGHQKQYPISYQIPKEEDANLRRLLSQFTLLVQKFMGYIEQEKQTTLHQRNLLDSFIKHKLYDFIEPLLKKERAKLEKQTKIYKEYYYHHYLLDEIDFFTKIFYNNRSPNLGMQTMIEHFREYSLGNMLLLYCSAINRERILQVSYEYPLLEHLLNYLAENWSNSQPLIQIYYHVLLLLRDENPEHCFAQLKILTQEHQSRLDITTLRQVYGFMLNYCTHKIRKGDLSYQHEKHHIYKTTLPFQIWNADLFLAPHNYVNIALNGIELGLFEWTSTFMESYKDELAPRFQRDVPLLTQAYLLAAQENYSQAGDALLGIQNSDDFFYTLYYKILWIQIHFEDEETNITRHQLPHALQALRAYLRRNNKMSAPLKEAYNNFMKMTERHFRIKQNERYASNTLHLLTRLLKDIETAELLVERRWLLKKVGNSLNRINS